MSEANRPGKPKGLPKSGGRQKGTSNKNSALFRHALDKRGYDIIEEIINGIEAIEEPKERVGFLVSMLPYMYSKLKDVEKHDERLSNVIAELTEDEINEALQ